MAEPLDRVKARAEHFRHATEMAEADPGNGVTSYSLLAAAVLSAEDVPGLLAEVERLRAELAQARADRRAYRDEARRRSNEDLTLRGILSPADRPGARPIPFDLGPSLADALRFLVERSERLDQVTALYEAADPSHHAPANGTLVTTTSGDRERAYLRVDTDTVRADGDWWPVDSDSPVSYGEVLGHDEPPQDRPTMVIEAYVSLDDLRCALDGVL